MSTLVVLVAMVVRLVATVLNIAVMVTAVVAADVMLVFVAVAAVALTRALPTALGYCSHKASIPPSFLKPLKEMGKNRLINIPKKNMNRTIIGDCAKNSGEEFYTKTRCVQMSNL